MTIDPWLGRKSDEEVEDMEKPNCDRLGISDSHLEMTLSDCCFQSWGDGHGATTPLALNTEATAV